MHYYRKIVGVLASFLVIVLATIPVFNDSGGPLMPRNASIRGTGLVEAVTHKEMVQYVSGDRIFDGNGSEVIWRGAGGSYIFHAGDRYQEAWQLHLPEIQAMDLNTIRLAFAFSDSGINPEYGTPSADILDYEKLNWVLGFLDHYGVKAILDCCNWKDMAGDFGSQKLIDDWVALARRYRGDNRIAAYELFNEPEPDTWDASVTSRTDVIKAYANLTDMVRAVDPEHIVIWQSFGYLAYTWDIDKFAEVLQPYLKPNIVFTFHRWLHKEWSFDVWNPEQMSYISVEYLVRVREKLNVPFWLGEFGSYSPFNFSNTEYQWTEQTLWRCEEQVLGWNLWMGRTDISKPWNYYLSFFPLKVFNHNLVRQPWNPPDPSFVGYVVDWKGVDRFEPYRVELWHNGDYVTLKHGIVVRVIVNHRLPDGTLEVVSDQELALTEETTIKNIEGTVEYSGDWNTKIYPVGYVGSV